MRLTLRRLLDYESLLSQPPTVVNRMQMPLFSATRTSTLNSKNNNTPHIKDHNTPKKTTQWLPPSPCSYGDPDDHDDDLTADGGHTPAKYVIALALDDTILSLFSASQNPLVMYIIASNWRFKDRIWLKAGKWSLLLPARAAEPLPWLMILLEGH